MRHEITFDEDYVTFPAEAYRVDGHAGIAWRVYGWETEPVSTWCCQDCGRSGYERDGGGGAVIDPGDKDCDHESCCYSEEPDYIRTGKIVCVMIGDDRRFAFDHDEIEPIERADYCSECGQIGCAGDGYNE